MGKGCGKSKYDLHRVILLRKGALQSFQQRFRLWNAWGWGWPISHTAPRPSGIEKTPRIQCSQIEACHGYGDFQAACDG
jgi:hypothetical protein